MFVIEANSAQVYTTATAHDVSTKLEYATKYVTKTSTSTYKTVRNELPPKTKKAY